jgi:hypothetical protein
MKKMLIVVTEAVRGNDVIDVLSLESYLGWNCAIPAL